MKKSGLLSVITLTFLMSITNSYSMEINADEWDNLSEQTYESDNSSGQAEESGTKQTDKKELENMWEKIYNLFVPQDQIERIQQELFDKIEDNNKEEVVRIIKNHPSLINKPFKGTIPLYYAATTNKINPDILTFFLEQTPNLSSDLNSFKELHIQDHFKIKLLIVILFYAICDITNIKSIKTILKSIMEIVQKAPSIKIGNIKIVIQKELDPLLNKIIPYIKQKALKQAGIKEKLISIIKQIPNINKMLKTSKKNLQKIITQKLKILREEEEKKEIQQQKMQTIKKRFVNFNI